MKYYYGGKINRNEKVAHENELGVTLTIMFYVWQWISTSLTAQHIRARKDVVGTLRILNAEMRL